MKITDLKPCPFCGSDRITVWNIRDGQQAVCKECKSTGTPTFHGKDGRDATWGHAVEAWNRRAPLLEEAASDDVIGYVLRYGGMCRDCADMDGVCQSGQPCDTDQRRAVAKHTIAALAYGIEHGFIANPFTAALAEQTQANEVLIAVTRPEEYEDVHPDILAEEAIAECFEWRVVSALVDVPAVESEPVAWQWEEDLINSGRYTLMWDDEPPGEHPGIRNVTPLFAHPPRSLSNEGEIIAAAAAVLKSWDERLAPEQERKARLAGTDHEYWSPAASMVSSEAIANLRLALSTRKGSAGDGSATITKGDEQQIEAAIDAYREGIYLTDADVHASVSMIVEAANTHHPALNGNRREKSSPHANFRAEPVAWRVRVKSDDPEEWELLPAGGGADFLNRDGYECQPLYTGVAPEASDAV